MSVDRLLDQLVAAAAISPEQAQLARALPAGTASTAAGRLEACGLDADMVLAAVAQVSGLQVASAALVARARRVVVKGGDPAVLRRLLAYPAGADKSRVLDVLIADPEAATHLPHLGLPSYRVWLAAESVVRQLIAKLPESGPDVATGMDEQMRMLRAIDHDTSPVKAGLELGGARSDEQPPPVAPRPAAPALRPASTPATLPRASTPGAGPPRTFTPGTLPQSVPMGSTSQAAGAASRPAATDAALPPAITLLPALTEVQSEAAAPVPHPEPLGKPTNPAASGAKRGLLVPLLAGGGIVATLAVVGVVLLLGREAAPTGDPALERQREQLDKARTHAAAGDHAYAFAACTDAIAAKPGTTLAIDAELICAKERIHLGERLDAAAALRTLIASLPATDARRAQAEELLRSIVGSEAPLTP